MKFKVGCRLNYQLNGPGTLVFNVHAINCHSQHVFNESFQTTPPAPCDEWTEPTTGNRFIRINAPAGPLEVVYDAAVENAPLITDPNGVREIAPQNLPLDVLPFLFPSRYCESDRLVRLANSQFGYLSPGFSRVTAICNYINFSVAYERGSSGAQTSAFNTVTERAGVCRDFAHLGIAFCRALGIPARFVSGYAFGLEPPDFHACFEAYLGDETGAGRWYFFDATRMAPQTGYVRIGSGRDAADASFATLFGPIEFVGMEITMLALRETPQFTEQAVALAEI
jgi:transglutaminase-like putative cysteine protease